MSQHIEIEFKNLLTKVEYDELIDSLQYKHMTVKQTNYYFDTNDRQLQQQKCALRIREKNGQFILTFKEPADVGALETKDFIDRATKQSWLNNSPTKTPHVYERIRLRKVALSELHYFGALKTKRTTFYVNDNITIALDNSFYHGKEDYELEIEVTNERVGQKFFQTFLTEHNILVKQTMPKIRRFFSHI